MAVTADRMGSSPELRNRILFTLFILILYRIGAHIPTPGMDSDVVLQFFEQQGGLFGMLSAFTGGALEQLSVFALGIMPYISASIIFQLLTSAVPQLEQLKKEGEQGRRKIQQYTRYSTVVLAVIQGYAISSWLMNSNLEGRPLVTVSEIGFVPFQIMTILTLTAGAMFVVWLGEQISERGIGEGASVIIFAGIAAAIPGGISNLFTLVVEGNRSALFALALLIFMLIVVGLIVFFEVGQRRIPIHVSQRGGHQLPQQASYLPLKMNVSGVLPPIFASSLLLFPATLQSFVDAPWLNNIQEYLQPNGGLYIVLFTALIVFFCFFYTEIAMPPSDIADNLKKSGKFIPGIRAGKSTSDYIKKVMDRITVGGAIYLSAICILPTILMSEFDLPFYFGGTSLLILVGVALNLIDKVNAYRYETLMKAAASARPRRRRVQF